MLLGIVFLDWYSLKAWRVALKKRVPRWLVGLWILPTLFMLASIIYVFNLPDEYPGGDRIKTFYFISGVTFTVLAVKAVIALFHLFDDVIFLFKRFTSKEELNTEGGRLTRGAFLSQLGIGVGAITLGSFMYGITKGKYNYNLAKVNLKFPDLPVGFEGVKILQISDMHLGSFMEDDNPVNPGLELVNEQEADYIFFTGDLVNSFAKEAEFWIPHFKKLKAKYGKFSILGNHDYGDYGLEKGTEEYIANLDRLKQIHGEMGFELLLDKTVELEKGGDVIDLIGVENWGRGRFPKYGDFGRATKGVDLSRFNILLSHDPTHWEDHIMDKENVNLTLSGHTHGFQLGVGLGNYKWSPAGLRFDRWRGLYEENGKYLYVNTGFGFLGFPGRVNMAPEITVFELGRG